MLTVLLLTLAQNSMRRLVPSSNRNLVIVKVIVKYDKKITSPGSEQKSTCWQNF